MAAKFRVVKWQKVRELPTDGTKGEQSAYWKWAFQHNRMNDDGEISESRPANPDNVCESEGPTKNVTRLVMRNAIKQAKLSHQERAVVSLLASGLTEQEAAKKLSIKRATVQVILRRARQKCEKIFVIKTRNHGYIDDQEVL